MWNMFKKDLLMISRDRSEIIILLGMPFILISILGFALGGLMEGTQSIDEIPLALVVENDLEKDISKFQALLVDQGLPVEAVTAMVSSAEAIDPALMLESLLEDPDLEGIIGVTTYDQLDVAEAALENDEVAAIVIIPEQFTYHTLVSVFLDQKAEAVIEVAVQDLGQIRAGIIKTIIESFAERYNLETSIAVAAEGVPIESRLMEANFGKVSTISTAKPVSSFQYYTIGVAVMFALYVASTISTAAFNEKRSYVFARFIISGETPLRYLLSKSIAATLLSFIQLSILFALSNLLFNTFSERSLDYWLGMLVITFSFSFVIGGLATLLTAISLQSNQDTLSGVFSGIIVTIFAFLGGSFLPVEQISPFVRILGNWTPNGAMMTAYLQQIQGFEMYTILPLIYRVIAMAIVLLSIALIIFPKRRLT